MSVKDALREIDAAVEESFDRARRHEERRNARSRRNVYEKALREVRRIAGDEGMWALSQWITKQMREEKNVPSGRRVRQQGARICRKNGYEVSTGSWLGA